MKYLTNKIQEITEVEYCVGIMRTHRLFTTSKRSTYKKTEKFKMRQLELHYRILNNLKNIHFLSQENLSKIFSTILLHNYLTNIMQAKSQQWQRIQNLYLYLTFWNPWKRELFQEMQRSNFQNIPWILINSTYSYRYI